MYVMLCTDCAVNEVYEQSICKLKCDYDEMLQRYLSAVTIHQTAYLNDILFHQHCYHVCCCPKFCVLLCCPKIGSFKVNVGA